ncbi:hypothetical protein G7070_14355 [Propioniciclava coleopterorum]|uniref:Tetratricopeptide repeat-containing protein n=1 Tax=Propioniciclava coleopterorum TaxID=2714937 RepID=A0A6G7Y8K6_9ACTN|nr:hypothetical protein [Propioniciclava coleopterorum]QIK73224.1 hypothetical protein G7070_14355 [Propioniciclava coleopterorum]
MNGGNEFVAVMADCERALGHADKALKLIKEGLAEQPDFAQRVELRLVEAGARFDLGQQAEALRLLKHEIEASAGRGSRAARASLRYGYADMLERTGDADGAERWFAAAAALDEEGATDAVDRIAALQGLILHVDEDALYDPSDDEAQPADSADEDGSDDEGEFDDEDDSDEDDSDDEGEFDDEDDSDEDDFDEDDSDDEDDPEGPDSDDDDPEESEPA